MSDDLNIDKNNKIRKSKHKHVYVILAIIFLVILACSYFIFVPLINKMISDSFGAAKPIIYLYPEEEMEITINLKNSDRITYSYPVYKEEGWKVLAKPNGELTYLENGRELYSLYYESNLSNNIDITDEGFVVEQNKIIPFLEEKLDLLGLNEREAEEFIIYWLPILSQNKYNYIRFATLEETEEYMDIDINPKPDTFIRITMIFKGLDKPIKVNEQKINKPKREGYVAVEWGGINLN